MEPDYIGIEGNYGYDTAIMVLKVNVIISKLVLSVSINWINKIYRLKWIYWKGKLVFQ